MHIKTGWTPRDYLDLYVTDDGETFDLVQGGQAGNNNALAFNRILQNCKTVADTYNKIFGTAWGYGFTPFTVQTIYSAANLQLIEDRCGELARALDWITAVGPGRQGMLSITATSAGGRRRLK